MAVALLPELLRATKMIDLEDLPCLGFIRIFIRIPGEGLGWRGQGDASGSADTGAGVRDARGVDAGVHVRHGALRRLDDEEADGGLLRVLGVLPGR